MSRPPINGRAGGRAGVVIALISVAAVGLGSGFATAQAPTKKLAGDLDPTFSADGLATVHFGDKFATNEADGLAIQPNQDVVVAGPTETEAFGHSDMAFARFLPDGSLDSSFGHAGKRIVSFGHHRLPHSEGFPQGWSAGSSAYGLALQPDGKIVAAGYGTRKGGLAEFAVTRLTRSGRRDPSFSGDGKATLALPGFSFFGSSLALQPDGKILVVGATDTGGGTDFWEVARFNSDGTLDEDFGVHGRVRISFSRSDINDYAYGVAVEPGGQILVSGQAWANDGDEYAVARLTADGALDSSFSGDGRKLVKLAFNPSQPNRHEDDIGALAVQPDGGIVVAGGSEPRGHGFQFGVFRLTDSGALDTSFSDDGKKAFSVGQGQPGEKQGNASANAVTIQPDGAIVLAGSGEVPDPGFVDIAVARLTPEGKLDRTFSGNGRELTAVYGRRNEWDSANAVALQPDGNIVTSGFAQRGLESGRDFAVARFLGN